MTKLMFPILAGFILMSAQSFAGPGDIGSGEKCTKDKARESAIIQLKAYILAANGEMLKVESLYLGKHIWEIKFSDSAETGYEMNFVKTGKKADGSTVVESGSARIYDSNCYLEGTSSDATLIKEL